MLLVVYATPVWAIGETNEFPSNMNIDIMEQEIVDFINNQTALDDRPPINATADNIDYSKAFKVYVDKNIFEISTNNFDEIIEVLENTGNFIYEVPVVVDGHYFIANIQRYIPLSNESREILSDTEIAEHESKASNNWVVSAISIYETESEYLTYIERMTADSELTGNEKSLLIGGLPGFREAVVITSGENGNLDKIIPAFPDMVEWERLGLSELSNETALDYETFKVAANNMSGIPAALLPIVIILIVVMFAGCIFIILRRKKIKSTKC
jgi:hypothetical protein